MRPVTSLVHSRTRLGRRHALFPLEGFPSSRLPTFPTANVRVLASPAMGAGFAQYLIDLPAGGYGHFGPDDGIETFYYVLDGTGWVPGGADHLSAGNFGLTPPGTRAAFSAADRPLSLLVLRKRFEAYTPADADRPAPPFAPLHGHESVVAKTVWADDPGALLQTLIPDDFAYDLAMNVFTFDPGHGLPIVETHVMEHGALIMAGKGLYYLDGDWTEVERDDFIWMGPFCPQSFYAAGPTPAKYIYYKNVNRDIAL